MKKLDFDRHLDVVNDLIAYNLDSVLDILVLKDWRFLEDLKEILNDETDNDNYKRQKLFNYFKTCFEDVLFLHQEDFDGHVDYENVFEEDEDNED